MEVEPGTHERLVFAAGSVAVGQFRCSPGHPEFRSADLITNHVVAFPRVPVWIRHAGCRRFLADPSVVAIYNRGQEYERDPVAHGDHCDLFVVSPEVAADMMVACGPPPEAPERPWRKAFVRSDAWLYLRQREILLRLDRGEMEPFEGEQAVLDLVGTVIRLAHGDQARTRDRRRSSGEAHRDLAERARAELARTATQSIVLSQLAATLGVSAFHLCRVFRDQVGTSPHAYRLDVRFRMALDRLADPRVDLTELAFELGFASHSHFTAALRGRMNMVPSELRRYLTRPADGTPSRQLRAGRAE